MEDPRIAAAKQLAQQFGLSVRYKRQLELQLLEARNLVFHHKDAPNPYVQVTCGHLRPKSNAVMKTYDPHWNLQVNL